MEVLPLQAVLHNAALCWPYAPARLNPTARTIWNASTIANISGVEKHPFYKIAIKTPDKFSGNF